MVDGLTVGFGVALGLTEGFGVAVGFGADGLAVAEDLGVIDGREVAVAGAEVSSDDS